MKVNNYRLPRVKSLKEKKQAVSIALKRQEARIKSIKKRTKQAKDSFFTSITLQKFNVIRLKHIARISKKSESELILRSLSWLLAKQWSGEKYLGQARLYNESRSHYEKVSLYISKNDYAVLWTKALAARMSNSYLCDLALILYLDRAAFENIQNVKKIKVDRIESIDFSVDYLGTYQQVIVKDDKKSMYIKKFCVYL